MKMKTFKNLQLVLIAALIITVLAACGSKNNNEPAAASSSNASASPSAAASEPGNAPKDIELLNVSYDPTRELYEEYNKSFAAYWKEKREAT